MPGRASCQLDGCNTCRLFLLVLNGGVLCCAAVPGGLDTRHVCLRTWACCVLWLQVRRWMFFHTTTLSLMDALDALANAAQAALTTQPQHNVPWWKFWGSSSSSRKQGSGEQQHQQEAAPTKSGADVEVGLSFVAEHKQQQQQQPEKSSSIELASQPSPAVLGSLVSLRPGSQDAAAAADTAAGLVLPQQQAPSPKPQHALPATAPATQQHAAAASWQLLPAATGSGSVKASFVKHTAWVKPWLPLALNLEQYKNLRVVFTQDVPRAFSSKQGDT